MNDENSSSVRRASEDLDPSDASDLKSLHDQTTFGTASEGDLLREAAAATGLSVDDLIELSDGATEAEVQAIKQLMDGAESSISPAAASSALELLEDRLGADLGSHALVSRRNRFARRVANVVGLVIGPVCAYIVIGGLLEGDSYLLGNTPGVASVLILVTLLLVLGIFEALHTSATQLKLADLGAVVDSHPRAARLHRRFRTDAGLSRFLAGRQLVVIIVVFFCSLMASFPDLDHWPFTSSPLNPTAKALVSVGLPGALFVYWLGQLVPQFLATRHALALTDSRAAGVAFNIAFFLESLGFARPGFWLAGLDRTPTTPIPSSPALLWQQAAREADGYGIVGIVRGWSINSAGSILEASASTTIFKTTSSLTDSSMLLPGVPKDLIVQLHGLRDGKTLALRGSTHREEVLTASERMFHSSISPRVGSLQPGDSTRVSMVASYSDKVVRDLVMVNQPTRFVMFRVAIQLTRPAVPPAFLRSYRVGDGLEDLVEIESPRKIEPLSDPEGRVRLEAVLRFPTVGTLHVLEWEVAT